ncbi:MAG: glycosyltransferase family 2 protein [Magnetococcales bacterium]|nr:glycosyltransferase family 2 protein [Magnetococcales bacterium]
MPDSRPGQFLLSVVVPMYNEESGIGIFFDTIEPILEQVTSNYEIICVNDGSADSTVELLKQNHLRNPRIRLINLSRNFGKELATTAGLDHASGDAIVLIDADLQDPPELIPDMVDRWMDGYDMVGAIRSDRSSDSFGKRVSANLFYRIIGKLSETPLPANAGDFRLMDKRVVAALKRLPERTRFMKGLFAWLGFRQTMLYFSRQPRAAGSSKWAFWKLWNFALEGIFSFSTFPLRIWTYMGMITAFFAMCYMFFLIFRTLIIGVDVPGYASVLVTILFFSGLNMVGLGIIGEYLGRVFIEVKQRPLYLVQERVGFDEEKSDGGQP